MPPESVQPASPNDRNALMLEAAKILVDELGVLASQNWEELPDLKKRKVIAASRLRRLRAEIEAADGPPSPALESLIEDLETKSRRQIRARLDLIGNQIIALQELSLFLKETLHVTLLARPNRGPGSSSADN